MSNIQVHDQVHGDTKTSDKTAVDEVRSTELSTDGVHETPSSEQAPVLNRRKTLFGYVKTKQFWLVLLIGQILSLCIVGTNTTSQLLSINQVSIPAFQTFFAYVTLALIWTPICIYNQGWKGWGRMWVENGWKYLILSFCDVEGNYFTVLGFRYTNLLSAQLINFWAIVVVVILSFIFLHVRYRPMAITGILVCVAGMGILLASDKIQHVNDYTAPNPLKGDLFALLGATFYGFSNTLQEFLVSKRPMYEVISMLAIFGIIINGTQAGIFDRGSFNSAVWTAKAGGLMAGYDLILVVFYSITPIVFRMGSAAFLNISLLTGNFWGAIVGIHVFHVQIHYLYPIAFVLIIIGLTVYFLKDTPMGDSAKPWLGANQEQGVDGVGTARRRVEHDVIV